MKNKQTIENNTIIAKFMGIEECYAEASLLTGIDNHYLVDSNRNPLTYDYSWDLLMPVVEKIESMGYSFHKSPWNIDVVEYISGEEKRVLVYDINHDASLRYNWYFSILGFIKWYNSNVVK